MSKEKDSDRPDEGPGPGKRPGPGRGLGLGLTRIATRDFASGYQIGLEAVAAIAVGAGGGAWLDAAYDTGPLFLLIGTIGGFAACTLRLYRWQRARDAEARPRSPGEPGEDRAGRDGTG